MGSVKKSAGGSTETLELERANMPVAFGGRVYPESLTFEQAMSFLITRGFYELASKDLPKDECSAHKKIHSRGLWGMITGTYVGFDDEQEIIDWVKRMIPNSL